MLIKWLEDVTLGQRIMITVALVVGILLALALYGYLTGAWDVPIDAT